MNIECRRCLAEARLGYSMMLLSMKDGDLSEALVKARIGNHEPRKPLACHKLDISLLYLLNCIVYDPFLVECLNNDLLSHA